ncbi:hypothetical protein NP233_g4400 [Leucocoprinus birnbaumii]|uniref:Uncharacterized protein n=1 Tax=Leucocoprinus birnbaumii TaxID=56174 RepID=A0AAD5VUQ8_9AGAR|nr:hypothetical protein NP233_g4400 [Leucocoprinus birnbaumii]
MARQTCKTLYQVTKSQYFWRRVLCSLETLTDGRRFQQRLQACTPSELEFWGMKTLQNYQSWALDAPLGFKRRVFRNTSTLNAGYIDQAELLPGGRWLVASDLWGKYHLFDLSSLSPIAQELFDPGEHDQADKTRDRLTSFTIWVDKTSKDLGFRLAAWKASPPDTPGHVTRTYICEINISEDKDTVSVSTKPIYVTRSYVDACQRPSIAISGQYVVEAWNFKGQPAKERSKLCVRKYAFGAESTENTVVTTGWLSADTERVLITADDQVVTVGVYCISIYTIPQLCKANKHRAVPLHYHQLSLTSFLVDVSLPFFDRGHEWMVVWHGLEILLFRFSPHGSAPPHVIKMGDIPFSYGDEWFSGQVTQDAAIVLYHDGTAKIITYSWDVEMAKQCVFRGKRLCIPAECEPPTRLASAGLDMANGLLAFCDIIEGNCMILDTVA